MHRVTTVGYDQIEARGMLENSLEMTFYINMSIRINVQLKQIK